MIEFRTDKYEWSHGKKPRGRGNWGFLINGDDERVLWCPGSATLTEAKKFVCKAIREMEHTAPKDLRYLEVAP